MEKFFTIYVCTYNSERIIEKCLASLLQLDHLSEFVEKIVVVDNNSNDSTKELIIKWAKQYEIIKYEFEAKQGLAHARQHAAYANTEWVIYVDDDNLLGTNWLIELYNVASNNNHIGVVNGAVIATPQEELSCEEENCLRVIYRDLACTHLYGEDTVGSKNTIPMGAGMCIRTSALKFINSRGWITLEGRKGEKLSSGEDGELCSLVFAQGYEYLFNPKMKLSHIIPKKRLQQEYVVKLIQGLVEGRKGYLKTLSLGSLRCFIRKIKYFILKKKNHYNENLYKFGSYEYWDVLVKRIIADTYIKKS